MEGYLQLILRLLSDLILTVFPAKEMIPIGRWRQELRENHLSTLFGGSFKTQVAYMDISKLSLSVPRPADKLPLSQLKGILFAGS